MTEHSFINDIYEARERIKNVVRVTPLLEYPVLNAVAGGRVFVKAETLQHTGSFKMRGAFSKISMIDRKAFPGGVVACSSGNHAQGVAEAARILEMKAVIVMPADAPEIKIARTRRSGADIVLYDRYTENRDEIAARLCEQRNAALVHPFDDPLVMAGQGTAGLEIVDQVRALGVDINVIMTPCGGGGLTAGVGTAVKSAFPDVTLMTVEPAGFDDTARSLDAGERVANSSVGGSICDALLVQTPGRLTFEVNRNLVSAGLTATEDEVCRAVAFAFDELKLVVEPGGAVALAAILAGKISPGAGNIVIVLSGGNVDRATFENIIKRAG